MIIATNQRLTPGQEILADFRWGGFGVENRVATNHPFRIIREATFEEYVQSHRDEMDTTDWRDVPWISYYEVATD